jgi:hypothetical protein
MKRRESIENRVATHKLQKQINKKTGNHNIMVNAPGKLSELDAPEREGERERPQTCITPEMVADFRIKGTVDRLASLLPSARKLRNAAFVQSMGAKAGGAFGLEDLHTHTHTHTHTHRSPQGQQQQARSGDAPWLHGAGAAAPASAPLSLSEELHCFCAYVQVYTADRYIDIYIIYIY